jgi:hypothetical protein
MIEVINIHNYNTLPGNKNTHCNKISYKILTGVD